jgi:hypothetical protein
MRVVNGVLHSLGIILEAIDLARAVKQTSFQCCAATMSFLVLKFFEQSRQIISQWIMFASIPVWPFIDV